MVNEVTTVRRVYIADKEKQTRSALHTVYAGEGSITPGVEKPLQTLTFLFGIARDVPLATFERFRDLGHATIDRPRRRGEDEDD